MGKVDFRGPQARRKWAGALTLEKVSQSIQVERWRVRALPRREKWEMRFTGREVDGEW